MITGIVKMLAAKPAPSGPVSPAPSPIGEYGIYNDGDEVVLYVSTNGGAWGGGYAYMGYGTGNYQATEETIEGGQFWVKRFPGAGPISGGYDMVIQLDGGPNGTYPVTVGQGNNF